MSNEQYAVIVECSSNGRFYIPEARKRGLVPLVIYPHLPDSPYTAMRAHTRDYLDEDIIVIDAPENMDELLNLLRPYNIVCVLAGSEYGVEMADALAKRLGLPGNAPETSHIRLKKSEMQEALKRAGLRHIRSLTVTSTQEAEDFWQELGVKRVVVKPLASAGTLGVHFCDTVEELRLHLDNLFADKDLFGRPISEVIIQEYIDGTEYIVNTASCGGVHRMTDMWVYNKVAVGSEGNAYDYARLVTRLDLGHREIIEYAFATLDALGYEYGPGHGEFMVDEKGPVLIEVGARPMGGGFSMDLLDECLGHHMTDCAMDTYLEPKRFEDARRELYRPAMDMMIKYFIAPKAQNVSSLPALAILKHLQSFRRANLTEVIESGALEKTVDLISAPAYLQLCHKNSMVLEQEYQTIRRVEQRYFNLLFAEGAGQNIALDVDAVVNLHQALPKGKSFVLVNDGEEVKKLEAKGVTAVALSELKGLEDKYIGGIFALSASNGLEECMDAVPVFVSKLADGALIKVLERSYEGFPYGSAAYELMLNLAGVRILLPVHKEKAVLSGIVETRLE